MNCVCSCFFSGFNDKLLSKRYNRQVHTLYLYEILINEGFGYYECFLQYSLIFKVSYL